MKKFITFIICLSYIICGYSKNPQDIITSLSKSIDISNVPTYIVIEYKIDKFDDKYLCKDYRGNYYNITQTSVFYCVPY